MMLGIFLVVVLVATASLAHLVRSEAASLRKELRTLLLRQQDQRGHATLTPARHSSAPSPFFEVETAADGTPLLDQFQKTAPEHAPSYTFRYSNANGDAFSFEAERQKSGSYEVFIRQQPAYGRRCDDGYTTHRYDVGTDHMHICFAAGVEPNNVPDACRKAVLWADLTSRYIATGREF